MRERVLMTSNGTATTLRQSFIATLAAHAPGATL
jgi:hypothetical protein